jgi:predicted aspartyl protease
VKLGWDYISKQMEADYANQMGTEYINEVDNAIQQLIRDMDELGKNNLDAKQLKGFVAEYWHADTFNIEATLRGSTHRTTVEGSTDYASVDISTNFGKAYSSKYIRTYDKSVEAQAKNVIQAYHEYFNKPRQGAGMTLEEYLEKYGYTKEANIRKLIEDYKKSDDQVSITLEQYIKLHAGEYDITTLLTSVYNGQERLIPTDQLEEAIKYLNQEIAKEGGKETSNRVAILANYKETLEKLVDRVSDGNGTESHTLTKDEAEAIAILIKEGKFKPEDFGLNLNDLITPDYIVQQALKSGYSAMVITLVMQLCPEIFKAIDYLIRNKELDVKQLKKIGTTAISASTEGFLRGSIASALTISCKAGKLGTEFININPHVIGALTVIAIDMAKSSVLVAMGKMTAREMGTKLTKEIIISSASLAGGALGQVVAPELPVLGYMLGSLIGSCVASVVVGMGEKCMISFCIDSGFTCFGLVKQDYVLPDEILQEIGIDLADISQIVVKKTEIKKTEIKLIEIDKAKYHTVQLTMVKRGVIGINVIGYV